VSRLGVLAGAVLLLVAGCSTGTPSVAKADVETQAKSKLTTLTGVAPDSVTCPGDLAATVGQTMRCELSAGGSKIGLTVTVTEVGDTAKFDIKVDDAPSADADSSPTTASEQ